MKNEKYGLGTWLSWAIISNLLSFFEVYVISLLWSWFVVPLTNILLSYWQIAGVYILIEYILGRKFLLTTVSDDQFLEYYKSAVKKRIAYGFYALAVGYILNYFMN